MRYKPTKLNACPKPSFRPRASARTESLVPATRPQSGGKKNRRLALSMSLMTASNDNFELHAFRLTLLDGLLGPHDIPF